MRNKISLFLVFVLSLAFVVPQTAKAANLDVQFENTPLFAEANFAPGDSVTRFIKVTNNTTSTETIALHLINQADPDNLAVKFDVVVKKGATTLFSGTLDQLFGANETALGDLAGSGNQAQYDVSVTFNPGSGDNLQGKTLGFDLVVGFQGASPPGGGPVTTFGGGGVGTGVNYPLNPRVLGVADTDNTIRVVNITSTTATVLWDSNLPCSSQVVYGPATQPHTFDQSQTNFGYPFATNTDPTLVSNHSVNLSNLTPFTLYDFRVVCRNGSDFAVSLEHEFTTLSEGLLTDEKLPDGQIGTAAFTLLKIANAQGPAGSKPGEVLGAQTVAPNAQNPGEVSAVCNPNRWLTLGFLLYALLMLALYYWQKHKPSVYGYVAALLLLTASLAYWTYITCTHLPAPWLSVCFGVFVAYVIWHYLAGRSKSNIPLN
jgi:hypothetical protein